MDAERDNMPPPPSSEPLPVVEFALRRPSFWTPRFIIVFGLLVVGALGYYSAVWPAVGGVRIGFDSALELLIPAAVCAAAVLMRWRLRPRIVPPVSFQETHLLAPRHAEARRSVRIEYGDILAVDMRGRGFTEQLFIGTRRLVLMFPRPAFSRPEAVDGVLKELYLRILRLPQGTHIVEQIARRRKLALAAMSRPATATYLVLGLFVLVFMLESLTGAFDAPFGPVRFGAATRVLIRDGEVYRVLASAFLHANLVHLYFNGLALFFLGAILERVLGCSRFLIIYLASGLAGVLAAVLLGDRLYTVNASAGTFGLLGAYVIVSWRFGTDLPLGLRQSLRWWALIAAVNVALPVFAHELDPFAIAAGLVAGMLISLLVIDEREALDPAVPSRPSLRLTAGLLAVLYGAAFVAAAGHALTRRSDSERRFAREVVDTGTAHAAALNVLAWRIARSATAGPEELGVADRAAEQALKRVDDDPALRDTWAAVQYRLGNLDAAVSAGRDVLRAQPAAYYAEHLALYLQRALTTHSGPVVLGAVPPQAIDFQMIAPAGPLPPAHALVGMRADLPAGATLFVLAVRDGNVVGLIRLRIAPGGAGSRQLEARSGLVWPSAASYQLALIDSSGREGDGEEPLALWNLETQVNDLP